MRIIGHRGARGLAAENTLAAVEAGLTAKADEIEIDVHTTKDDAIILAHDPTILDLSLQKKVAYQSLDFAGITKIQPDITTLTDVINLVVYKNRKRLLIEIKPGVNTAIVCKKIKEELASGRLKPEDIEILSYSFKVLSFVRRALPDLTLVVNDNWSAVRATRRARSLDTKRIQLNVRWLWHGVVRQLYRAGFELSPFTVNDPARIASYKDYLYGVVTDYPDRWQH